MQFLCFCIYVSYNTCKKSVSKAVFSILPLSLSPATDFHPAVIVQARFLTNLVKKTAESNAQMSHQIRVLEVNRLDMLGIQPIPGQQCYARANGYGLQNRSTGDVQMMPYRTSSSDIDIDDLDIDRILQALDRDTEPTQHPFDIHDSHPVNTLEVFSPGHVEYPNLSISDDNWSTNDLLQLMNDNGVDECNSPAPRDHPVSPGESTDPVST